MEIKDNQTYEEINFDGEDLSGRELVGSKFNQCSFVGTKMESLITRNCAFAQCNFRSASLNASTHHTSAFTNCKFEYTNLFSADFIACKLVGSIFKDVNMAGLTINNGDWSYTSLRLNDLKGINFSGLRLIKADLYNCNLEKANFKGADLTCAILAHANIGGADLRDANIEGVDFRDVSIKGVKMDISQTVCIARSYGAIVDG